MYVKARAIFRHDREQRAALCTGRPRGPDPLNTTRHGWTY